MTVADIVRLVDKVAEDGHAREQEMRVRRPPLGRELLELRVRVAPLGTGVLLILVDDLAEERRVDAVRRDFVANVSHELKTPVGALSLLAETVFRPQMTRNKCAILPKRCKRKRPDWRRSFRTSSTFLVCKVMIR